VDLQRGLRRTHWLGPLQALLTAGVALAGLNLAVQLVALARTGQVTVQVPTGYRLAPGPDGVPPDVLIDPGGTFQTYIREPTTTQTLLFELTRLPTLVAFLLTLALVWHLVRKARQQEPFTAATVRRLRMLAVAVMASQILAGLAEDGARTALLASVAPHAVMPPLSASTLWWWLLAGLGHLASPWLLLGFGFLAVAELINRGQRMRTELAEVI
jgi:Protein of unknown function (DUF2975)